MIKKGTNKVFVYSIPRETATKLSEWTNTTSGKKMKKTKFGLCNDGLQALYSPTAGGLANGLSYKPWTVKGKVMLDKQGKELTLQDKVEKQFNLDQGHLTNRAPTKGDGLIPEQMKPYYHTKVWKFKDGCTVLDLNNLDDLLGYHMILDSKYVANSEKEMRSHKWPKAKWYIALSNESDELKYNKSIRKSKAFAALHSKEMTEAIKRRMIHVLELANSTAPISEEQTHNLLYNYLEATTFTPGSNLDKFEELNLLINNPKGKNELLARHMLKQALDTRVIYEKSQTYNWVRPGGVIELGNTYTEAIDFLQNPKKEALIEDLQKEIKLRIIS